MKTNTYPNLIATVAAVALALSCASVNTSTSSEKIIVDNPYQPPCIQKSKDEFKGTQGINIRRNHLTVNGMAGKVHIYLNAVSSIAKDGSAVCALAVTYDGPFWMFISSGESLVLLVDGKRMSFKGGGSGGTLGDRHVVSAYSVREIATYATDVPTLKTIGRAKEVRAKIYCDRWPGIEANLSARNIAMFAQMSAELDSLVAK